MLANRLYRTDHPVARMALSDNVPGAAAPAATPVRARLEHLFRNMPLQGAALVLCEEIASFRTREPA